MRMKRLFITLLIGSVVILAGCGKSSAPTEAMIKDDIIEHQNEYLDNNLYFYTDTGYIWGETEIERDMEVSSLKIQKSRTEDTSYTAWCDVSFENDSYKDNCVIVVSYNKYDNDYWELNNIYEEENTRTSAAIQTPDEEMIRTMICALYGNSNIHCYWPQELISSELNNNICQVTMNITNGITFQGEIADGFAVEDVIEGSESSVKAEVNIQLEYDGVHTWRMTEFESELPDADTIIKSDSAAIIKLARFILNGDRNLDSLSVTSSWTDGNMYYFDITGAGGTVVLCEEYIPQTMQLDCLGLDVSRWNYEYGGKVEGHALFYDPEKFLVPHL